MFVLLSLYLCALKSAAYLLHLVACNCVECPGSHKISLYYIRISGFSTIRRAQSDCSLACRVSPLRSLMVMRPFNWFSTNFQLWIHTHCRFLIISHIHRPFVTSFDSRMRKLIIEYLNALHTLQCRRHVNCVCVFEFEWSCSSFHQVFAIEGDSYFNHAGCSQTTQRTTGIMDRKLRMRAVRCSGSVNLVQMRSILATDNLFGCSIGNGGESTGKETHNPFDSLLLLSLLFWFILQVKRLQTQSINFLFKIDATAIVRVRHTLGHNELIWGPRENQRHKHLLLKIGISRHFTIECLYYRVSLMLYFYLESVSQYDGDDNNSK